MINNRNNKLVNKDGGKIKGIRGEILTFKADPFINDPEQCYDHLEDGLIIIQDGIILEVGNFCEVCEYYPELNDIDHYKIGRASCRERVSSPV